MAKKRILNARDLAPVTAMPDPAVDDLARLAWAIAIHRACRSSITQLHRPWAGATAGCRWHVC